MAQLQLSEHFKALEELAPVVSDTGVVDAVVSLSGGRHGKPDAGEVELAIYAEGLVCVTVFLRSDGTYAIEAGE